VGKPGTLKWMAQNPAFDRITVEAGKCGGKPCIRGMRITVRRVLEILATTATGKRFSASIRSLKRKTFGKRSIMRPPPWMTRFTT